MFHLAELLVQVAAHAHARRVLVVVFGVFRFQILQLAHEPVEFLVADGWCIENVVVMIMRV